MLAAAGRHDALGCQDLCLGGRIALGYIGINLAVEVGVLAVLAPVARIGGKGYAVRLRGVIHLFVVLRHSVVQLYIGAGNARRQSYLVIVWHFIIKVYKHQIPVALGNGHRCGNGEGVCGDFLGLRLG